MNKDQVFFRNPSLVGKADDVDNQQELVQKLMAEKKASGEITFEYTDESKPCSFPGFAKIRDLKKSQLTGLFNSVLRYKPNIIQLHIRLGHYPNAKQLHSVALNECGASKPRWPRDIAPKFANVFSDPNKKIVEFIYVVSNAEPGNFRAHAQAMYVETEEEYRNEEYFEPAIGIRYFVPNPTI
jgi:hypothetical protein